MEGIMKRNSSLVAVLTVFLFIVSGLLVRSAVAETQDNGKDNWQFEVTPYLFAAGMDGTVGVGGVSSDIDMSFDDILERLDQAFMLLLSAQKGDWLFSLDGTYINLDEEKVTSWQGPLGNTNTAQLNADLTQQIYAFSAGRRVLKQKTKVDVLGVLRYTSLDTILKLALTTGADLLPDGSREVVMNESWWDAAIAARVIAPFADKWNVVAYADIGAGDSDLTYQLLAGVNWQFGNTFSAKFGYRYFYQDYKTDDFKWDMANEGLYAGLGIRF
jgi:hypothetical protein